VENNRNGTLRVFNASMLPTGSFSISIQVRLGFAQICMVSSG
jgi:hypothetical protein